MNIRKISVPTLLDLLAVSDCGSINRAAQKLNVTQSALTRSIRKLEVTLGAPLLKRTASGAKPTIFGEMLLNHARAIDQELREAAAQLDRMRAFGAGELHVGMAPTIAHDVGATSVLKLMESQPGLSVRIIEGGRPLLLSELRAGHLDFAITVAHDDDDFHDLRVTPLLHDELTVVARSGHPLAAKPSVTLEDLSRQHWVVPDSGVGTWRVLEEELKKHGLTPPSTEIVTSSLLAAKRIVLDSDRVAALSVHICGAELRSGQFITLRKRWSESGRVFAIFTRTEGPSPAALALIKHLKATVSALKPIAEISTSM